MRRLLVCFTCVALLISGCDEAENIEATSCLPTSWERHSGPVLRDPIPTEPYEVASDGHVFVTFGGRLAMIFSGDDGGNNAIKLAFGADWDDWEVAGVLLGQSKQPGAIQNKETPFYISLAPNDHRIYFIGYADEETYQAEVYEATAEALEGPWSINPEPVMRRGLTDGQDVYLITSPSVIQQDNRLVMTYLGWNGFQDVTQVWSFVTTSELGSGVWSPPKVAEVPIGMEGQVTRRPDGGYVTVATQPIWTGREAIFAACSDNIEGPWQRIDRPLLTLAGDQWEQDEIIGASIAYDADTGAPYLFYTGADHSRGWWMMMATPRAGAR